MACKKAAQSSSNFAPAFFFLPEEERNALSAVYAFCRAVDDAVDEPSDKTPQESITFWNEEIERLFNGTPTCEITQNLLPYIKKFPLKKEHFLLVIEGVAQDIDVFRYNTFKDLEFYLFRVAGAVSLLCTDISGHGKTDEKLYAKNIGYAVQLTNIIRDVASDSSRGRIYIPLEDLKQFSVSEDDLLNCRYTQNVKRLLEFETKRARGYYKAMLDTVQKGDAKKFVATQIMAAIYEGILNKIEKACYNVFNGKIKLTKFEKILCVLRGYMRS